MSFNIFVFIPDHADTQVAATGGIAAAGRLIYQCTLPGNIPVFFADGQLYICCFHLNIILFIYLPDGIPTYSFLVGAKTPS
jgi:hypothetical protein